MFALSSLQVNDVPSAINPVDLLPPAIAVKAFEVKNSCSVGGLTGRRLILWASDGAQFSLVYPQPFSQALYDYLTLNTEVAAFELVGERLKYGRLKRLLDFLKDTLR